MLGKGLKSANIGLCLPLLPALLKIVVPEEEIIKNKKYVMEKFIKSLPLIDFSLFILK